MVAGFQLTGLAVTPWAIYSDKGTFYVLMSYVLGEGHITLRSLSWWDAGRVPTPPDSGGENGI